MSAQIEAIKQKLLTNIEKHGFTVMCVTDDKNDTNFAYTVGMTKLGLPEFYISGTLDQRRFYTLLDLTIQDVVYLDDPVGVVDLTHPIDILSGGYAVKLVEIPQAILEEVTDRRMPWIQYVLDAPAKRMYWVLLPDVNHQHPNNPAYKGSLQTLGDPKWDQAVFDTLKLKDV